MVGVALAAVLVEVAVVVKGAATAAVVVALVAVLVSFVVVVEGQAAE